MLSTANNRLLVLQIFERPSISTILIIGFVGVSTQINFVFDEIKFSISLRFLRSVNTNFNPNFLKTFSKRRYEPPYRSLVEIISSPGENNFIIASIAESPELKANPYLAFSKLAIDLSKACLVGF